MDEKIESLLKNNTWDLVKKPKGKMVVGCKWIFKMQEGLAADEPRRFKDRIVAKGYTQRE